MVAPAVLLEVPTTATALALLASAASVLDTSNVQMVTLATVLPTQPPVALMALLEAPARVMAQAQALALVPVLDLA